MAGACDRHGRRRHLDELRAESRVYTDPGVFGQAVCTSTLDILRHGRMGLATCKLHRHGVTRANAPIPEYDVPGPHPELHPLSRPHRKRPSPV